VFFPPVPDIVTEPELERIQQENVAKPQETIGKSQETGRNIPYPAVVKNHATKTLKSDTTTDQ
jgi:hypothetical protein